MHRFKKIGMYVGIAFVCFYLFTQPAKAADAVNGVFNGIVAGADQLAVFVNRLT